jgi:hypothetical protein
MAWRLHFQPSGSTSAAKGRMGSIEHTSEECVGNWRLLGLGEDRMIQCDECGARFEATPENRLAAIDENYAGIYLRRLSSEGAALGGRKD